VIANDQETVALHSVKLMSCNNLPVICYFKLIFPVLEPL